MSELPIEPQTPITPGDLNQGENYNANVRRANANDQTLADAVGGLKSTPAVRSVTVGATKLTPDEAGNVTLPGGVVAPATTTAQRDAIASPVVGQLIYNTTNDRPEVYSPSGWRVFAHSVRQVFTASGTYAKPVGATRILVECFGGGGAGYNATGTNRSGGGGGGYSRQEFLPSLVPASVPVTIGAGGTLGQPGGTTTFGDLSGATGGAGGTSGQSSLGGRPIGAVAGGPFDGGTSSSTANTIASSGYGAGGGNSYNGSTGVTNPAGSSGTLAGGTDASPNGASRSGTGLGGSGGYGGVGNLGGAGGVPGGGGGTGSSNATSGPGARGECIVTAYF